MRPVSRPGKFTVGTLGGPQSQSGRFGERKILLVLLGINRYLSCSWRSLRKRWLICCFCPASHFGSVLHNEPSLAANTCHVQSNGIQLTCAFSSQQTKVESKLHWINPIYQHPPPAGECNVCNWTCCLAHSYDNIQNYGRNAHVSITTCWET